MVELDADVWSVTAFTIWLFYTPFFFVSTIMFVKRRNVQPIKARSPLFIVISSISGYAIVAFTCWEQMIEAELWPCAIGIWVAWLLLPLYFLPYPLRALRIFFVFRLSQQKLNHAVAEFDEPIAGAARRRSIVFRPRRPSNATTTDSSIAPFSDRRASMGGRSRLPWSLQGAGLDKYKRFFKERFFLILLGIGVTGTTIVGLVRQFMFTENFDTGCKNSFVFYRNLAIGIGILMLMLLLQLYMLAIVKDQFNIAAELKLVCVVWVLTLVPYIVINFGVLDGEKVNAASLFPPGFLIVAWTIATHCISLVWSLYGSFYPPKAVDYESKSLESLGDILDDEDLTDKFQEFLVSEFCVESLLFWLEVRDLEQMDPEANRQEFLGVADEIVSKYLTTGAPLEINVESRVRKQVLDTMASVEWQERPSTLVYREAQQIVFRLMDENSYKRFLKSDICKAYVMKIRKQEEMEKHLKSANLL